MNIANLKTECPTKETLEQLLDGTLGNVGEIESHIEQCTTCQIQLDGLSHSDLLKPFRKDQPLHLDKKGYSILGPPTRDGDLGTIERYHVESELGRGGAGVVFGCFDPELQRQVAIKVLNNELGNRSADRFARESRVAAKVNSDFVVSIHSIASTKDGRPFIVMPLIKGISLKQKLNEKLPSEKSTAQTIKEIATGLQAIHDLGIVHRDIKPANIMLDDTDQRAKLTDFGLAQDDDDQMTLTQANVLCGTPDYMSPEQSLGSTITYQSDIYSLGVTLYECLTGTTPFRGQPLSVLKKHSDTEPVPPRRLNLDISFDLQTVCLKAIAKDPDKRYQSASDLAADLGRWLTGKPIQARPVSNLEKLSSWSRRNRLLSTSLLLLGLTLIASSIITTWLSFNSQNNAQLAMARAQALEKQTAELTKTTKELQESNTDLRSALDTFFDRFLKDESFRMQLSTLFRNEMVYEMLAYYGRYLKQDPGTDATIEICSRVKNVTEHSLDLHFFNQADVAISWNLERLEPLVATDASNIAAINLLTNVQLQAAEFYDNYRDGKFKGNVDKAIENSQLVLEIDPHNLSAQRNLLMSKGQQFYVQRYVSPEKCRVGLQEIVKQMDALAAAHPDEIEFYRDRTRLRSRSITTAAPDQRIQLRSESIKILHEMKLKQNAIEQTSIRTQRNIGAQYALRGKAYLQIQQLEKAADDFDIAIEIFRELIASKPAFLQPRMDLAETLVMQGDLEVKRNDLELALNFYDSAIVEFELVIQMETGQFPAIKRISNINQLIAKLLFENKQLEKSGEYVHRAVESFRRLFKEDEKFVSGNSYSKFNQLLEDSAEHFEAIGDTVSAQKKRDEATNWRKSHPNIFTENDGQYD